MSAGAPRGTKPTCPAHGMHRSLHHLLPRPTLIPMLGTDRETPKRWRSSAIGSDDSQSWPAEKQPLRDASNTEVGDDSRSDRVAVEAIRSRREAAGNITCGFSMLT